MHANDPSRADSVLVFVEVMTGELRSEVSAAQAEAVGKELYLSAIERMRALVKSHDQRIEMTKLLERFENE